METRMVVRAFLFGLVFSGFYLNSELEGCSQDRRYIDTKFVAYHNSVLSRFYSNGICKSHLEPNLNRCQQIWEQMHDQTFSKAYKTIEDLKPKLDSRCFPHSVTIEAGGALFKPMLMFECPISTMTNSDDPQKNEETSTSCLGRIMPESDEAKSIKGDLKTLSQINIESIDVQERKHETVPKEDTVPRILPASNKAGGFIDKPRSPRKPPNSKVRLVAFCPKK